MEVDVGKYLKSLKKCNGRWGGAGGGWRGGGWRVMLRNATSHLGMQLVTKVISLVEMVGSLPSVSNPIKA